MLAGKLAVVTGAGGGIGRAIAQTFAKAGATVVVADVNATTAEQTKQTLESGKHSSRQCDVSRAEMVQQLCQFVHAEYSTAAHIVVNNAGIATSDSPLHRMTEAQFDEVVAVNLKSVWLMTQTFSQAMITAGHSAGCSIINISGIGGRTGMLVPCNYAASKAGVIGLTKTTAIELAAANIRVNVVLPGFIRTPMTDAIPAAVLDKVCAHIPFGHMGTPDDVANACLFLASDMSRYVTGAQLDVTGGMGM